MRLVLVAALPYSGAEAWADIQVMQHRARGESAERLQLESLPPADALFWDSLRARPVRTVYIVATELCSTPLRDELLAGLSRQGAVVECAFFANDPQACMKNAQTLGADLVEAKSRIQVLSRRYHLDGAALPVLQQRRAPPALHRVK